MDEPTPEEDPIPPSLTQRTFVGLQWTYLQSAVGGVLQIAMAAVLGRLLTPSAFGLLVLANLVLRFVEYFARAGVSQAVVQKLDLSETDVRAAFWLSGAISCVFTLAAWLAAPLAAEIFNEPDLIPVLRAMSAALLISGLGAPAGGLLRRHMRFRAMAVTTIGAYIVGYAGVGVGLAIAGAGVWALVGATLTQTALTALTAYALTRHPLRPTRSRDSYRSIFRFGSRVSVVGFFEFLGNELDTLAVGRYAGVTDLGLYNRGYILVSLPIYQLKTGLSKVLFPALSSIQTDLPRLRSTYLSAIAGAAAIGVPICAGIAVAAREIILVVLGPQWVEAATVVPWLAVAAASSLVGHFGGVMAEAQGFLNGKLVIATSRVALLAAALYFAAGRPIAAYGAALALAAVYAQLAYVVLMSRTLEVRATVILGSFMPALATAAMVAVAQSSTRELLGLANASDVLSLVAQITASALVLVFSLRIGPQRTVARDIAKRLEHVGVLRKANASGPRRVAAAAVRLLLG